MYSDMIPFPVVIHRCGTSKGIFIHENELPKSQEERDRVIRGIFGSPDRRQIDGLGGGDVLTSKLAIVGPSRRADCDVDYTFAQVSFDTDLVDYGGNCGNICAGVGPFAVDEGLVPAVEPVTRVRIYQVNTDCVLIADVPVQNGKALSSGDYVIDGVPGSGAQILLDFHDTAASTTGKLLPTGNCSDLIQVDGYGVYEVSIVDAGNVVVFIEAAALGLSGTEDCEQIERDRRLFQKMEAIRAACAVKIGIAKSAEDAAKNHAYAPFFAIVSRPQDYTCKLNGKEVKAEDVDLVARLSFMLHMHKTYPGTGAVCTAAAARIAGTIVHRQLGEEARRGTVIRIGHPGGVFSCEAIIDETGETGFSRLAYARTARRIMEGVCYVSKWKV